MRVIQLAQVLLDSKSPQTKGQEANALGKCLFVCTLLPNNRGGSSLQGATGELRVSASFDSFTSAFFCSSRQLTHHLHKPSASLASTMSSVSGEEFFVYDFEANWSFHRSQEASTSPTRIDHYFCYPLRLMLSSAPSSAATRSCFARFS